LVRHRMTWYVAGLFSCFISYFNATAKTS
jgi:hypothetical protein